MRVDLFDFELPPGLIAQRPAVPRDSARLLEVGAAGLLDRSISDLPQLLRAGDLLVLNDTRVLPARLRGHRLGRDKRPEIAIEMLLLRRHDDGAWTALARPGKRLQPDDRLRFGEALSATIAARADDSTLRIRFDSEGPAFAERLSQVGAMPLPTCNVTAVVPIPCAWSASISLGVKCSAAVGAATAPSLRANMV